MAVVSKNPGRILSNTKLLLYFLENGGFMEQKLKKDGTPDKRYKPKKLDNINPTLFEGRIKRYFEETDPLEWSVPSLCNYLQISKQMFKNMADHPDLASVHEYASNMIEADLFKNLKTMKNPTGAIFALKTMGYSDNRGVDLNAKISIEQVLKNTKLKA